MTNIDIIKFSEFEERFRSYYGNKAANLATLYKAGFNVPKALMISSTYLNRNISNSSHDTILFEAFNSLTLPVVVRSSAISEDSNEMSYAGIYNTIVNITSWEKFVSAVNSIYKSANAKIARSYDQKGQGDMAILVQEIVDAEHAGVVFTANPVNGNRSEMVIEYFNGLGISVVSGETTPQHLVVNRETRAVMEFIKSDSGTAYYLDNSGGCRKEYLIGEQVTLLKQHLLERLIDVAMKIEADMGSFQDIEWAVVGDDLYILQSRPITAGIVGGVK